MREPQRVVVAGAEVVCSHCECRRFVERKGLVQSRFFGYETYGELAHVLQCGECGHLEWFLEPDRPERRPEDFEFSAEDVDCLSCGENIPAELATCQSCGWSYR